MTARTKLTALAMAAAATAGEANAASTWQEAGAGRCGGKVMRTAYYSYSGGRTASGARFDPNAMTAAHRSLPFGTRLVVTHPRTGRSVTVTITDRGPFTRGLQLDLSRGAARAIGMGGTATLCVS